MEKPKIENRGDTPLAHLRGLGPKSQAMLATVGITTVAELNALGAIGAYERLWRSGQAVSLNMLWSLEGALTDRDWRMVASDERQPLLKQLEERGIPFKK